MPATLGLHEALWAACCLPCLRQKAATLAQANNARHCKWVSSWRVWSKIDNHTTLVQLMACINLSAKSACRITVAGKLSFGDSHCCSARDCCHGTGLAEAQTTLARHTKDVVCAVDMLLCTPHTTYLPCPGYVGMHCSRVAGHVNHACL